jgi:hypothetical protein
MRRYLRRNLVGLAGVIFVVVLGTSSAIAAGKIYYGSRAGMTVTVRSMSDLDTSHAQITTEHTRDDAVGFCRDYERQEPGIRQELAVRLNDVITADCPKGIFTNFFREIIPVSWKKSSLKGVRSRISADEPSDSRDGRWIFSKQP